MHADYLQLSENAQLRAKTYVSLGEHALACQAYCEAADYMLRYSQLVQGQIKTTAQQFAEQLIIKAQQIKASAAASSPVPTAVPEGNAPKPAVTSPDNHSNISNDLQSYQRSAGRRPSPAAGSQCKFAPVKSPNVYFSDIAGMEHVKNVVRLKVIEPLIHPELYERFHKSANGGILLYGPPGTGKTMIAQAIATEAKLDFFFVRCSDIVGSSFGDGERNLSALFEAARACERAMIFFDEFESLACKRGGKSTVMNRLVPELLSQMDGFQKARGTLIVLASTNRPWDLDSAVLRPPRMTERIYVGLPDFAARRYILAKHLDPLPQEEPLDYDRIANSLEGFNCADIKAFVDKLTDAPIMRGSSHGDVEQFITLTDVEATLENFRSSVQKSDLEAFAKWEDSQL